MDIDLLFPTEDRIETIEDVEWFKVDYDLKTQVTFGHLDSDGVRHMDGTRAARGLAVQGATE